MIGEIGLTGRLRQAAQMDRRLEECAKLGIVTVVAPDGFRPSKAGGTVAAGPRVTRAETVRQAIAVALEARKEGASDAGES